MIRSIRNSLIQRVRRIRYLVWSQCRKWSQLRRASSYPSRGYHRSPLDPADSSYRTKSKINRHGKLNRSVSRGATSFSLISNRRRTARPSTHFTHCAVFFFFSPFFFSFTETLPRLGDETSAKRATRLVTIASHDRRREDFYNRARLKRAYATTRLSRGLFSSSRRKERKRQEARARVERALCRTTSLYNVLCVKCRFRSCEQRPASCYHRLQAQLLVPRRDTPPRGCS